MSLFHNYTADELTKITLSYAPNGKAWSKKQDISSNLYKFFLGISSQQSKFITTLNQIFSSLFIKNDVTELERHEADLSIPDSTFDKTGSIEERQIDVIVKKFMMRGNRAQDYIDIAAMYGITIEILPLASNAVFPIRFPLVFAPNDDTVRYTMVITFKNTVGYTYPLDFPIVFAESSPIEKLKKIFNTIKPATTLIIYRSE